MDTVKNQPMTEIMLRLLEQSLELVDLQRSKQNMYIYFSRRPDSLKILNQQRKDIKYRLNLKESLVIRT
jgi:hypothetical protein